MAYFLLLDAILEWTERTGVHVDHSIAKEQS
jgi:hypothetical protein